MVLTKMDGERVQLVNQLLVLNTLRNTSGYTRAGLAKITGLSTTSAANIVRILLDEGMVIETKEFDEQKGRGRRGQVVRLNPDYLYTIGIEMTDTSVRGVLIDFNERPLYTRAVDTSSLSNDEILGIMTDMILELKADTPVPSRLQGVAIALHGLVDTKKGVSLSFPGGKGWRTPVAEVISSRVELPVDLQIRMLAATTAELRYGVGRKESNFVYFNSAPGKGFGIGIVVDGKIIPGFQGFSGQFGHLCVEHNGKQCFCGSQGCLATIASPEEIVDYVTGAIQDGVETSLAPIRDGKLHFSDIIGAAREGDKLCVNTLESVGEALGLGFSYVINLLNPRMIVLAGTLPEAGEFLIDAIRRSARLHSVATLYEQVQFVESELDDFAGARGAASCLLDTCFMVEELTG
ncbi:MAG: ROK family protein [Firmicutes bacterium]|mgnify:CR=1 FL=1|nr:ROK family protein [Bacillota bacterium]